MKQGSNKPPVLGEKNDGRMICSVCVIDKQMQKEKVGVVGEKNIKKKIAVDLILQINTNHKICKEKNVYRRTYHVLDLFGPFLQR